MISPRSRPVRVPCLAVLAGLALGCVVAPLRAQSISEIQITPETMTLGVGQRQVLFAAAYDRQGNLIPSAQFGFTSSDTAIVRVSRDGTVVGVSPGLAKVEARSQGRRASMAVLIRTGAGPAVGSTGRTSSLAGAVLTLDPASVMLLPGESVRIAAQAVLEDGTPSPPGRVTWKSLRPEVAAVDSTGMVVAITPGRSIVQATNAVGLMATAPIEVEGADFALSRPRLVLGPDDVDTLRATVPSQSNRAVRGGVLWQSTDTAVVRVGPTGIVTARSPGQAEIVAVGFGHEHRVPVLVHRLPQSLVVSPRPAAGPVLLPVGSARELSAAAETADSLPIPEARFHWEMADTGIILYDPAKRLLTAKGLGTTTLTARLKGFEPVVWTIQVIQGLIALERPRVGLVVGERANLVAAMLDDSSKAIGPAPDLQWSTDRAEIATVAAGGAVEGVTPGRAVVTAKAPWGKSATGEVFVVGDLLISSNRAGGFGLYQIRLGVADGFLPVLLESGAAIQAVRSPDRTRIAFSTNRHGSYDIYVMDADGRNAQRLTTDPGNEGEPAWTPDGTRIVFAATPRTGPTQIHSFRPDGTDGRVLTASTGGNSSPTVSPDGRSIAFISARDGNQEIYLMALDGSGQRRLTKTPVRESNPRFLPNRAIVYVAERGRSKGSQVLRLTVGAAQGIPILETEQAIGSMDVSRDGERVAYVLGKLTDASKRKTEFSLIVQKLASGSTPGSVPLRPDEQVVTPSF